MNYQSCYEQSLAQPAAFWAEQARRVAWYRAPTQILTPLADGTHEWFADGRLNTSYLALDHQIEQGRGEQTALAYDSPVVSVLA